MIYAISPITYGVNERSRLSGIGLRGNFNSNGNCKTMVFKDVIKESAMACVGSETYEQ